MLKFLIIAGVAALAFFILAPTALRSGKRLAKEVLPDEKKPSSAEPEE